MHRHTVLLVLSLIAATAAPGKADTPSASTQAAGPPPKLIPVGSAKILAGQYILTNINTGQALYVSIDGSGKLQVQEPQLLHISVQDKPQPSGSSLIQQPAGQPAAPPTSTLIAPQQASGLLSSQDSSYIKNKIKKEIERGINRHLKKNLPKL